MSTDREFLQLLRKEICTDMNKEKQIEEIRDLILSGIRQEFSVRKISEVIYVNVCRKTGKWVPVKEKLPEIDQTVLVNTKYGILTLGYAGEDKWWEAEGWHTAEEWGITHWMPLPEPPAESEDTE